jgi:hypothetical protein
MAQTIPAGGTIKRCPHHVYNPDRDSETAHHCGLCREQSYAAPINGFHFPPLGTHDPDKLKANGHQMGECPECHSAYHFVEEKFWVCAECQTKFEPPRRMYVPEDGVAA